MEDAYEEDKQRDHSDTVSIANQRSAQQGKEDAQDAQPSGKGHSSSNGSRGSSNGKGWVSSCAPAF